MAFSGKEDISGTLSSSVGSLGNLENLYLNHKNTFTGSIPSSLDLRGAARPLRTYGLYEYLLHITQDAWKPDLTNMLLYLSALQVILICCRPTTGPASGNENRV
jgi:hypothetical protein